MEKIAECIQANTIEIQEKALSNAIKQQDEEAAATIARSIRNRLLNESDKEVILDRFKLKVPNKPETVEEWLTFLKELGEVLTNEWALYRQALRDLPKQEGFPFEIEWPVKPSDKNDKVENNI